ncbi:hypothetical protein Abol_043_012 [Acetobacter orleanensis JCM 7639]|nr:hypothetical protein Abol_043_012 [Acetobacter orleanensis JCM 7639]
MFMRNKRYGLLWDISNGGETGIRTLGTLLTYTRFPSVRLKPLGHLSGAGVVIATLTDQARGKTTVFSLQAEKVTDRAL